MLLILGFLAMDESHGGLVGTHLGIDELRDRNQALVIKDRGDQRQKAVFTPGPVPANLPQ